MNTNVVPMQPTVGTRQGDWIWDGTCWICCPDGNLPTPCPPFGPPVFSGPTQQPPWYPGANGGVSFGQSPPPNPVRGHFWWNGLSLQMFDGAAWVIVGGGTGASTGTNPPTNPFPGQQWFNGSVLFVWDGVAWVPVSGTRSFIQATAPPAPNPGDTWWDGMVMRIWDGSTWELVGPGAFPGPVGTTTQVLQVTQTSNATVPASTWSIAPINGTPSILQNATWDVTTKVFKPTRAGFYAFQIGGWGDGAAFQLTLLKNDSGGPYTDPMKHVNTVCSQETLAIAFISAFGITQLNGTTDFVRLWVFSVGGDFQENFGVPILAGWSLT